MTSDTLLVLVLAFFTSWQVKLVFGLILLDLVLGLAAALKTKTFDWQRVAEFYKTAVLPYILGYLVLYLAINFILPVDQLGPVAWLNEGAVDLAGLFLVTNLAGSLSKSFKELYQTIP